MRKLLFYCLTALSCLFFVCSCEEDETVVSNIQSLQLTIEDGNLTIRPVFGEGDNCTYTIAYYIDDKEIGRERKSPYELKCKLLPEYLSIGEHTILVEFYGKHSGSSTDVYIEKKLAVKYTVDEYGSTEEGKVEKID